VRPPCRKARYIRANPKLQPERQLFRSDVDAHAELHFLAWRQDPHAKRRPLFFGRVEGGICVGHGFGDEDAPSARRVELEEMCVGRG